MRFFQANTVYYDIAAELYFRLLYMYKHLTFYGFHRDIHHISVCFQNAFVNHPKMSWKIKYT